MAHDLSIEMLRLIRQSGALTRGELARSMGISLSLVSKITLGLLNLGLIEERVTDDVLTGRPADRLVIHPEAAYCIGLDVGSHYQVAVITNLSGEIVASLNDPSPDLDFSSRRQQELISRILDQSGISRDKILGLGVGICHIVDAVTGMAYRYGNPDFPETGYTALNIPIRNELVSRLAFPHIVVDDIVRALGTAEVHYGLGAGEDNFIYLLVDTGIGMAIMINGVPFIGNSHIAGEIAHIPVGNHNIVCNCGNTGCLNMVAGITPVLNKVKALLSESVIRSSMRMQKEITIEDVIEAGERGDKIAIQALIEAGEYLGMALAVILNLFGPRLVVAGGILARSTIHLDAANRLMRLRALEMAARGVELKLSPLNDYAGARGAAAMAINSLFTPGEKDIVHLVE